MLSLSIFVYSTPLADRECACVAKVAIWYVYMCLIYMYIATVRLPNPACQNWECNCVDEVACLIYIYFCRCCLQVHLSTQLRLPTGSVLVWPKSLFDTYICVWYLYIATIRLPNSACQNWECNCVDEVTCSICVYFCRCCLKEYLSTQPRFTIWYVYMCLIYIYIATL